MKILHTNWLAGLYLLLLLIGALIPLGMGSTTLNNNYALHVRADYLLHALFYIPLPVILLLSRWGKRGGWMQVILFSIISGCAFRDGSDAGSLSRFQYKRFDSKRDWSGDWLDIVCCFWNHAFQNYCFRRLSAPFTRFFRFWAISSLSQRRILLCHRCG